MSAHSITSEVIPDPTRSPGEPLLFFYKKMVRRRYRKTRSMRRRRGFRRRSGVRKALSRIRSLSRKVAGEVKKMDVNAIVPETSFT